MAPRVFNTLTRGKEDLAPLHAGLVRMYVCGVTVYDLSHIGHGRSAIVFDVMRRYLKHRGHAVKFIKNFTDIDDKIIRKANQEGVSAQEISERYIEEYRTDMASLGVAPADIEPKATEHVPQMIALIERLIAKGVAYPVEGDVYFEVRRFPGYGKLSGKNLEELQAGARVEVDERKRDPMDFALWKATKPGEPSWKSPWGQGRPGWHIECSAMAARFLGETFDIHGGGIDLVFPHHENELAQSRAAFGTKVMANVWLHNGFLQVEGEKMSKSLGNFVTIREALRDWPGEVIRLNMLKTHYRQPIDWTEAGLREAGRTLDQWYEAAGDAAPGMLCADAVDALSDDLNTPKAFTALYALRDEAAAGSVGAKASLKATAQLLGLLGPTATEWHRARRSAAGVDERRVAEFIASRVAARKARNFAEADRIRAELEAMGIAVKDSKDPKTGELTTAWEVKR